LAYVHLHVHSQFSLLDGAVPIGGLASAAADLGQSAVALTDHCNLYGAVTFHKSCKAAGIHPVIGAGLWVQPEGIAYQDPRRASGGYHVICLVQDDQGYKNLCRLITDAIFEGMYYKPRVDLDRLQAHRDGLVFLTSGLRGPVRSSLVEGRPEEARAKIQALGDRLGSERLFLELQDTGLTDEGALNQSTRDLAQELGLRTVVTNNVHYLTAEQAPTLEVLQCIGLGRSLNQADRIRPVTDQLYLKSESEMRELFPDDGEALDRTAEIALSCDFHFTYGVYFFPASTPPDTAEDADTDPNWAFFFEAFPPPRDFGFAEYLDDNRVPPRPSGAGSLNGYFEWYCRTGLALRLARVKDPDREAYDARLVEEFRIIESMGFAAYFLIVAEFINWAKEQEIPVGPGRGSAAGSLAAWSMRITDIDPLRFDLLFERFLNPERISMPDVDIDFCQDRREEVIEHTRAKYGRDRVAQIITYGKLQAKAAVRDVSRVCDINFNEADRIAKLIPEELGITLEKAEEEESLRNLAESDPKVRRILGLARCVEGLTRQTGVHAAGVVVADRPLVEICPLYRDGPDGGPVVQFDMNAAESIGLIKFDFLGLKTLDQIRDAVAMIARNTGERIDMSAIPEDDRATFKLLQAGDGLGVFQVESSGMRELLQKLKPSNLEDLVALVALYRPGPLNSGMVDDFIDRKHGRKAVEYPLPQLEPILKNTYGVVVYQEQVMQIAQVLANYSLGEADLLRRAMGKKKVSVMEEQKSRFLQGAAENQVDLKKAEAIFDLLAQFAAYGFNKSHSAAYGYIGYQTAWLKANHRAEYMAALMSIEANNTDKVLVYIGDCRRAGLEVKPPDMNESFKGFDVRKEDRGAIRFGLGAVKNVGGGAVDAIVEARDSAGGRFKDLMDCLERLDYGRINKRVLENLIKCGAFDWTAYPRAALFDNLEGMLSVAQTNQRSKAAGQFSLFGSLAGGSQITGFRVPDVGEWSLARKLSFERDAVGFFLSGHPISAWKREVDRYATCRVEHLIRKEVGQEVSVAGMPSAIRSVRTRRGDRMAFVTLDDDTGSVECVFFSDPWDTSRRALESNQVLLVRGKLEKSIDGCKILADSVELMSELRERGTRKIDIHLQLAEIDSHRIQQLKKLLGTVRGSCTTSLHVTIPDRSVVVLRLPASFCTAPDERLVDGLSSIFRRNDVVRFQ
jgi:DNA polymerase-3 subunit alpha